MVNDEVCSRMNAVRWCNPTNEWKIADFFLVRSRNEFFGVWRTRAPQMTSSSYRLFVLVYPIRFDHFDNCLEYESLFSYEECINSKLQERNWWHTFMSHMMTMRNQRRPLGLLLLTVALLPFISFGKEDRNPTCEQVNSEYDDGVVCNEPDSTTDFSHDLSALDPNQAPKRCDDWNIEMLNLNEMDPLYVCIEWHRLYGELKPATRAPTAMPSIVPTLSPSTCTMYLNELPLCVKTLIAVLNLALVSLVQQCRQRRRLRSFHQLRRLHNPPPWMKQRPMTRILKTMIRKPMTIALPLF
jgi:hypothetical protein